MSGPREPILGFIVTPEEVAGIRAMVADHDTIQTELTRLRGLIPHDAHGKLTAWESIYEEWYACDHIVQRDAFRQLLDIYAALLREAQR